MVNHDPALLKSQVNCLGNDDRSKMCKDTSRDKQLKVHTTEEEEIIITVANGIIRESVGPSLSSLFTVSSSAAQRCVSQFGFSVYRSYSGFCKWIVVGQGAVFHGG